MRHVSMKFLYIVLLAGLLALLIGCGGGGGTDVADPAPGGEPPQVADAPPAPDVPDEPAGPAWGGPAPVDLGGFEFRIIDFHTDRFIAGDGQLGTPVGDAMMAAIESIEQDFNASIVFEYMGPGDVLNVLQPAVFAGDKYADMIVTTMWAFGGLIGAGLMADLNTVPSMDLHGPQWSQAIHEAATIDGSIYATAGIFSHWNNSWVVYFNQRIWDELGLPDPYDMVRRGEWTFERMREFGAMAAMDLTGDGVVDSMDDRWGLLAPISDFNRAFYLGMGGRFFSTDPQTGLIVASAATPQAFEIVSFMRDFANTPGLMWRGWAHIDTTGPMFVDGRSLFLAYMAGTPSILREMNDDFGMLPMPKGTPGQPHHINKVDHNAPVIGITMTNRDLFEVGTIMEALAARFEPVRELNRFDLDNVFLRSDDCVEMMDNFIQPFGGYDMSLLMQRAHARFSEPMGVMYGYVFFEGTDFTSEMEALREVMEFEINEFLNPGLMP